MKEHSFAIAAIVSGLLPSLAVAASCPPTPLSGCASGCVYYESQRRMPSAISWDVRLRPGEIFANSFNVVDIHHNENTSLYLRSRGVERNNDGDCVSFSRHIPKGMSFDDFVGTAGASDLEAIDEDGFDLAAQYDIFRSTSAASGTQSITVDLLSKGVIDGATSEFWASAGITQRATTTVYLDRASTGSYENNVLFDVDNDIALALSRVYEGLLCEYPIGVPLTSYRIVQRVTVQALDQNENSYCTFRVQGSVIVGVDGTDNPRIIFSGWTSNDYFEDVKAQVECRDALTNQLYTTSREAVSGFDNDHEQIGMCSPAPGPNEQAAYVTLSVPGEPFAMKIQIVNSVLPILSRIPSANFDIDPDAFFGGDLNGSGRTKPADFDYLLSKYGYTIDDLFDYEPECDLNGDGIIDDDDIELFETYFCLADYNGDGTVDVSDLLDFLDDYSNLDIEADMNEDSIVDILDYLEFANYYSSGC